MRLIFMLLFVLVGFVACQPTELHIDAYFKYIRNPENGLYKTKQVNQFEFNVRYLPIDYLVYKNTKNKELVPIDSLKEQFKGSLTFLLQVAPNKADGHQFDVMTQTVSTREAYKKQSFELNFLMQEYLELKLEGKTYKPVLVELENTYELTLHRNFMVTYALEEVDIDKNYKDLDFIYHDQLFGTGIHHFLFEQEAITNIPSIKL